ncbi:mannose-6-phosphate isomerase [Lucifera butyrica]|uniref:mannose-1-phosphate guanylyltransferase n=1 Tax=Lucifera butyrica TaxID=1351585 RepID=A0A498RGT9_9FIRM|nr:mannose-1-phosphate guanylyltransferase/mannose-6-phosphate isomerase [Lucifera butyrica]VBB09323.1 mannose-6-phosphate isomerase [Lucifera butyrica]
MKVIILAGGGGTRLFPLSRKCLPKQFLKLDNKDSLLTRTVQRFLEIVKPNDIVVVTNEAYFFHVKSELIACGAEKAHILLEPAARNTAPAIGLAVRYCMDLLDVPPTEALFVTPADHVIEPQATFKAAVRHSAEMAEKGYIVTFGILPDKPETGYGYIQAGEPCQYGFRVDSFREKPDLATAESYLAAGNYYWNSGMFVFTLNCIMEELQRHQPAIYNLLAAGWEEVIDRFDEMPKISIDYAVAEKSDKVITIPFTGYWNDIGSWDSIYDILPKDEQGNGLQGDCLPIDCTNSLLLGRSRLIAGIGLEDVLVVETDDVILVAKKGESQKVKDLVETLKIQGRKEAEEHTTVYRPWGSSTVLNEGEGYKTKKVTVNPGEKLSLQLHYHRSEHWIVLSGTAKVTMNGQEHMVHENNSIFVPQATKHRLENPGKIPLEMIEVQNGRYLEEDDIVRFDDEYGRD